VATPAPAETAAATPGSPSASPPAGSSPTPRPPAARSVKNMPLYVSNGPAKNKWIALTFDADMYPFMYAARSGTPEVDTRIIDLLEKTNTPATFFLNGLWAKAYPDIVKRLAKNPDFQLGNHSWDHADWTSTCADSLSHPISPPMTRTTEVTQTADLIEQLTGVQPQFYRFPGGCHGTSDTQLVRKFGETGIGWSCFFGDTMRWTTAQQVASVQHGCGRGSIVVTHINGAPYHPNVYEALKVLIPWWKSHGWTVVTVGTLFNVARPSAGN